MGIPWLRQLPSLPLTPNHTGKVSLHSQSPSFQFPLHSLLSDPSPLKVTLGGDVGTADGVHRDIISIAHYPTPSLSSLRPPPLPRLRDMLLAIL